MKQTNQAIKKVVLAYSGGLDTSVMISWLKENYGCEILAVCADVGQMEDLKAVEMKALKSGADAFYKLDLVDEFAQQYIFPAIKAGGKYENEYLLGTALARPLIGKKLAELAMFHQADAIVHGCTGKGNDQVRFEMAIRAFHPTLPIIAPWRIWEIKSRDDEFAYAKLHGIEVGLNKETSYSVDQNLWHVSHEGLDLEDPANEPNYQKVLKLCKPMEQALSLPSYITLGFEKGVPVSLDGEQLKPSLLIQKLNAIGGLHGVGVDDIIENRLIGMKVRGIYENPAGAILFKAHDLIEKLTLDRDCLHLKQKLALDYATLVYNGQWFTPSCQALMAFFDSTQQYVTGTVKLKLFKGLCTSAGVESPYSLYHEGFATFGEDQVYNQGDSQGFVNLYSLSTTVQHMTQKGENHGLENGTLPEGFGLESKSA